MYILFLVISLVEAATGLALLIDPFIVAQLLFGSEIIGAGIAASRIAGVSLISLGIACWPGLFFRRISKGQAAMLVYNLVVTIYLGYLALVSEWSGPLLWPAIYLHGCITVLLFLGLFTRLRDWKEIN